MNPHNRPPLPPSPDQSADALAEEEYGELAEEDLDLDALPEDEEELFDDDDDVDLGGLSPYSGEDEEEEGPFGPAQGRG